MHFCFKEIPTREFQTAIYGRFPDCILKPNRTQLSLRIPTKCLIRAKTIPSKNGKTILFIFSWKTWSISKNILVENIPLRYKNRFQLREHKFNVKCRNYRYSCNPCHDFGQVGIKTILQRDRLSHACFAIICPPTPQILY